MQEQGSLQSGLAAIDGDIDENHVREAFEVVGRLR
jgi:hypothetical protein